MDSKRSVDLLLVPLEHPVDGETSHKESHRKPINKWLTISLTSTLWRTLLCQTTNSESTGSSLPHKKPLNHFQYLSPYLLLHTNRPSLWPPPELNKCMCSWHPSSCNPLDHPLLTRHRPRRLETRSVSRLFRGNEPEDEDRVQPLFSARLPLPRTTSGSLDDSIWWF